MRPRLAPLRLFALLGILLPWLPAAAQTFAQPTVLPTGNWPVAIYTADMNRDGIPDLVYLDPPLGPNQSVAHILLGDGKGGFTAGTTLTIFGNNLGLGDFLNNGNTLPVSILVTPYNTNGCQYNGFQVTVDLLQPNGTSSGAFNSSLCSAGPLLPVLGNFTTARLHGPAAPADLLFTDTVNNLLYTVNFHGNGAYFAGTFTATSLTLPTGPGPLTLADLNNDGKLDLVITGSTGVAVLLGNGDGTFQPPVKVPNTAQVHSILLQDVNLDGRPDLIAEGLNGRIDVFPGNGDGTFSATSIGGTGTLDGLTGNGGHLITIADLNHDGQLDALTATPAGISTLFGAGTSYLKLGGIYNAGPGHTSYAVADFNGDGNLDLAVDSPEGIAILFGNADGGFQTSRAYAAGAPAQSGVTGTFTASGHPDAAVSVSDSQAQLLQGNGDGTFQPVSVLPVLPLHAGPNLWSILSTGDFNGDGKPDLLLSVDGSQQALNTTYVYAMTLLEGNGDGTFKSSNPDANTPYFGCQMNHPQYFGTTVATDLNADGITDAVKSTQGVLLLLGSKGLTPLNPNGSSNPNGTSPCSDFAHDLSAVIPVPGATSPTIIDQFGGHLEVAFASYPIPDLAIDGSLTTPGQLTAPDISTTFGGTSATFSQPYFPGAMVTADLDRDGNTDLLVTYANLVADPTAPSTNTPNYLYIWYGSGGGKFLTSARHPVNPVRIQLSRNYYQVAVADLNNDGIPDLLLSDGYLVSYQLGLGDGTFGPEHHLLAGRGINTISTADLRGLGKQDLVLANGGAALTNPVANHDILAADPDVNTGGITVLLNAVTAKSLTSTLIASPEPSAYNASYRITATLTGSPLPTGTVTFSVDGTVLGSVTATNGVYSIVGPNLLPGTHTLTATYSGDANYPAQSLTPGTHVITRAPTTVTLTPSTPLTVYYGQPVDGRFGIYDSQGNSITALNSTGTYSLYDNAQLVPSCTNLLISAPCLYGNPQLLDAGTHAFAVAFNGDPINAPSISPAVTYTVLPDLTTITLTSSKNPANSGDAVTFTATLTGNVLPPTGSVKFLDAGTLIGGGTLIVGANSSTLIFTTSTLAAGTHPITAVYAGTVDFNPAISALLNEVIQSTSLGSIPSVTTLTSNLNPSAPRQLVTLTAQVQVPGVFPTIPTGTVTFLDGTTALGTAPLNPFGLATFQTATLITGTHPLTASYAGAPSTTTPSILPSVSPVLNQLVTIPLSTAPTGFQMTVTPGALTLGVGRTGILAVNILATGGFAQPVQLSCSHLAPETSCQFSPSATVPPGGGNVTLQLFTNAPRDCNSDTPYFLGGTTILPTGLLAAAFLFLALLRRRTRAVLLFLAALTALTTLSGCGHCTDLGTKPGNYSFTITATAQGTPITEIRTATIPLTMTIP